MEPNTSSNLFELHIDQNVSAYLGESARWARFFAVVGFIFTGLVVLMGIFAGSLIGLMSSRFGGGYGTAGAGVGGMVSFIYIAIGLLYFFPCLYLFNFSSKMKIALGSNDQEQLGASFRNLKSCFRFVGILTIIWLAFSALAIVFFLIGLASMR
jgi:uncharacterized protein DUF5362